MVRDLVLEEVDDLPEKRSGKFDALDDDTIKTMEKRAGKWFKLERCETARSATGRRKSLAKHYDEGFEFATRTEEDGTAYVYGRAV